MAGQVSTNWVNLPVPIILLNPEHRHRSYTSAYPVTQMLSDERKSTRRLHVCRFECELSFIGSFVWMFSLQDCMEGCGAWQVEVSHQQRSIMRHASFSLIPDPQKYEHCCHHGLSHPTTMPSRKGQKKPSLQVLLLGIWLYQWAKQNTMEMKALWFQIINHIKCQMSTHTQTHTCLLLSQQKIE